MSTGADSGRSPRTTPPEPSLTDWLNLAHFFADELLERWHDTPPGVGLPDDVEAFMGLTEDEYAMWAEGRYHDLAMSLREREA